MSEFDFPKRVFTPALVRGRHADTRPVKSIVEKLAQLGASHDSNPFADADSLSKALEKSEWGDAVVRYPPLPDKSFVPYARGYYLFLRGRLVASRGKAKKEAIRKAEKACEAGKARKRR